MKNFRCSIFSRISGVFLVVTDVRRRASERRGRSWRRVAGRKRTESAAVAKPVGNAEEVAVDPSAEGRQNAGAGRKGASE